MKMLLSAVLAVAVAGPFMMQGAQAEDAPAQTPATPTAPAKVAGTKHAVGSGIDMETVETSLLVGGVAVAVLAGASNGNGHHDCHCHGGGGTTGTTGTN